MQHLFLYQLIVYLYHITSNKHMFFSLKRFAFKACFKLCAIWFDILLSQAVTFIHFSEQPKCPNTFWGHFERHFRGTRGQIGETDQFKCVPCCAVFRNSSRVSLKTVALALKINPSGSYKNKRSCSSDFMLLVDKGMKENSDTTTTRTTRWRLLAAF